jgi:hypothetical protein
MGPQTLPTIWGTYMKLVTKYQISALNSCREKCDEKCTYMFNVCKNQLSRKTGSRNLTDPGSIFGPIRFLLPVCRFCWFLFTFNIHLYMHIFRRIFLSNYWWQESDIWSLASYRYPISWEAFLDPSDSYFLFEKRKRKKKWMQISNKKNSVGRFWQGRPGKGKQIYF